MTFNAFWLPALADPPTSARSLEASSGVSQEIRLPALDPDHIRRQVDALIESGMELQRQGAGAIVAVVDRVARRLLDPGDELRRMAEALIPPATGYSLEMTGLVLDRMAADWRADRLDRLLSTELGDASALDTFSEIPGRPGRSHAVGPRLAVHIFSGNVPGVAVTSLIRTLLVKSPSLGKTASGEPVLAPLFARALAEENEAIGRSIAIAHWKGGDAALEEAVFQRAEAVIAYGSARTIESVRGRVPSRARFLAHGSRVSFGIIAREALADPAAAAERAREAALAVATFDQQGCVSPHLMYCEEGGAVSPEVWTGLLAEAMESLEADLPRGTISGEEAAAIQQLRGSAEIGGLAGSGVRLFASRGSTRWTVLFEPGQVFQLSCLNRTVRVVPVASIDAVPGLVGELGDVLQTVAMVGNSARLGELAVALARKGVSRIAGLREAPWPPPWWHHDGRPPLGDLVRWCDWEEG